MELVERLRAVKESASISEAQANLITRIDESLKIIINAIQEYG